MPAPLIVFDEVTKTFGSITANDQVSLKIFGGEVLALLGENGAGKSTLMKTLFGIHRPDSGSISLDGQIDCVRSPADAMRQGLGMVFQNFSLIGALTVRDNLLMSWPATPLLLGKKANQVLNQLRRVAPNIDPDRRADSLSVGEQQLVELCKVLNLKARVIILDEPTSVLTPDEAARLHAFVRQLAADGIAVVFITHKMSDVHACADRVVIMRQGRVVDEFPKSARTKDEIVQLMMGESSERLTRPSALNKAASIRLRLTAVSAMTASSRLKSIDLAVHAGEIIGIAGVAGNGQNLLAEAIAGIATLRQGDIELDGVSIARRHARASYSTPIGYLPESPRVNAVVETLSVSSNLRLRQLSNKATAPGVDDDASILERFNVMPLDARLEAGKLSGGNLQKLVIAREFGENRPALLACYPTMGLDVSASRQVYSSMIAQAAAGAAVVWISEDLDDLLGIAHRIAVLHDGTLSPALENDTRLTRKRLGELMTGSTTPLPASADVE